MLSKKSKFEDRMKDLALSCVKGVTKLFSKRAYKYKQKWQSYKKVYEINLFNSKIPKND